MNHQEIQEKLLNNDFLFYYSYQPGFVPKLCALKLFISQELDFDLIMNFHEKNINEFTRIQANKSKEEVENYIKNNRRELYLSSKIPRPIRNELSEILKSSLELKETYIDNSKNEYTPEAVSHKTSIINHEQGSYSVDLGYGFNKKLMDTISEKNFMNLINLVEHWLEKISDDLMKYYIEE